MNSDLRDLARWAMERAQSAGAEQSRVRIRNAREVEIAYRERKPEVIKEASSHSLGVEVLSGGRYSAQSTSDLRKDALADFIGRAVFTTKLLAADPDRALPDPRYYEGRSEADLKVRDSTYESLTPDERHAIARQVGDACIDRGGDKIISVEASEFDERAESIVIASNGFEGRRETTAFGMGAVATVNDSGDRRPNGHYYVQAVSRAMLPPTEECGRLAAEHALDQLDGRKIATETLPIIVVNRDVDRVLDGLLQAMMAANIHQQRSFLAERKGQPIASDKLTMVDDPLLPGGLGSRPYDGEGLAAKRRVMIEAGVLCDFYTDWHYSRKLKWEPTIGEPSNLIIIPGPRSVADIMEDLGRGILITGFVGGNSNSTTGDFSTGIFGRLFENGVPTQAVAEMNIASNHNQFWRKLVEVANDPWIYGAQRTPSLVFADVVVSGA
jgi:PmbA protein